MVPEFEPDRDPDVSWLAWRYVAGEMGSEEAESFEVRLDRDQAAREAVAEAVELSAAVAAIGPATRPSIPLLRRRPVASVAALLGVGAAVAASLAWIIADPGGPVVKEPATPPAVAVAGPSNRPRPESVVLAWSSLRYEGTGAGAGEEAEANELLAWNEESPLSVEAEGASERGLPLWLLDAASLARRPGPAAASAPVEED